MAKANTRASSNLLLDEHFEKGDDRFLDELFPFTNGKKLKSLAEPWYRDTRPFARRMMLQYVDDGCDRPHHRPLVKTLFKLAEKAHDDELIGRFMVAFDRMVQRKLVERSKYDWSSGGTKKIRVLVGDTRHPSSYRRRDNTSPLFSGLTRRYLQRRALRYFRDIGRKDPLRYGKAIRAALVHYKDEHLDKPERLLDAWGLMNALYHGSPALKRNPTGIRVADGQSLGDLEPAPLWPAAWKNAFDEVFDLVTKAKCRTVRVFAIEVIKGFYKKDLDRLTMAKLRPLLASAHEEVQIFAADLLRTADGISGLTVADWLELLRIENPAALAFLCEAIKKHVSPSRLKLDQCVDLACSPVSPVAELGLEWAMTKKTDGRAALETILKLASAKAPRVREGAVKWIVSILSTSKDARMEHVRDLIDSKFDDVRRETLAFFEKDVRYKDDTALWSAVAETPYDDVRAFLLAHLVKREKALGPMALERIWATTLLAVHRGAKHKRTALSQIAERITAKPTEAEGLLTVLGFALRSVRPPERRAALAAVSRAAFSAPALRSAISRKLPELSLFEEGVS